MHTITRADVLSLADAAVSEKTGTHHLTGSQRGRYIVHGLGHSVRLPAFQIRHPATVNFVTEQVNAMLRDYPRTETVSSWRDIVTGDVYLGLGSTYDSRDTALYIATARGERAVHDTERNVTEWTER